MKTTQIIFIGIFLLFGNSILGQESKNQKVILITLDGFRWQELFGGADEKLIGNKKYVSDVENLKKEFWRKSYKERRMALLPFIWNDVPKIGQIHGNRNIGSKVNLTNEQHFSYPGYNEILTGKADDKRIVSNDKINNPNVTILEKVNLKEEFKGKVAAFGSWDVFPYIINEERSGVPVNAGYEPVEGVNLSEKESLLNAMQEQTPKIWKTVRLDAFTHNFALEYLKKNHPELLYISYGETDDFAHEGNYQAYLKSAKRTDAMLKELWEFTQNDSFYKDNTVFVITTDHGRGTEPLDTWKHHGSNINGADQTWLIVYGSKVKVLGEVNLTEQLHTTQVASTVLRLMGVHSRESNIENEGLSILKD